MHRVHVSHARVDIFHDCVSVIEFVGHSNGTIIPRQIPVDLARHVKVVVTTAHVTVSS